MIFEPIIIVYSSENLWNLLLKYFESLAPKESTRIYENKLIKIKPKFIRTDTPENLSNIRLAPYLLLALFDSANKNEFLEKDKNRIFDWSKNYSKRYIPFQAIFVDDPKKTKSKNFFGEGSNFINFLNNEFRPLSSILIKSNGEPKKKDINILMPILYEKIVMSMSF